jgi:hypothetical protein
MMWAGIAAFAVLIVIGMRPTRAERAWREVMRSWRSHD